MTEASLDLVDSHAHLDEEQFGDDLPEVLERGRAAGVRRIVNIGYRPRRWPTTIAMARKYPGVFFTLGVHPHHADEWNDLTAAELRRLAESERPVAIGEIGLDFFRNLSTPEQQEAAFSRQIKLAIELDLPIVIHQREAEEALINVLQSAPTSLRCVLHSFDGTARLAALAEKRGWYLGVGGLMTRAAAVPVREILKTHDLERMLLETDSPYLVPAGIKNRRNEPANVLVAAKALAELKQLDVLEIAQQTTKNAVAFFGASLLFSATTPST